MQLVCGDRVALCVNSSLLFEDDSLARRDMPQLDWVERAVAVAGAEIPEKIWRWIVLLNF